MSYDIDNPSFKRRLRNILLSFLVTAIFIAILFFSAGSLAWVWGWIFAGLMTAGNIVSVIILDPGLLEERTSAKSGYKKWDVFFGSVVGRVGPFAIVIVSGLDFRFGWSAPFPRTLAVLGLIFCVLGYVLSIWAMRENRFFSSLVRIQKDRGHQVITTGPYRIVRHPGYLGSIIVTPAMPFAMTSYWALVPAVITVIVLIIRTVLEDNTLKLELEGYSKYTETVRYRLIPGIW